MKQLALAVNLPAHAVFDTFMSNGNEALIVQLYGIVKTPGQGETLFLSGAKGSGKTHLLQAMCHAVEAPLQAVYLDLAKPEFTPEVLSGWEQLDLICLDNIERVQKDPDWEEALFDLFNRRLEAQVGQQASLVMASEYTLKQMDLGLPDLRSRLSSGLIYRLEHLSDTHIPLALNAHARQRGLEIPKETMDFLLKRLPRELSSLMTWLDNTDIAALEAQRKLTIPFVKSLL